MTLDELNSLDPQNIGAWPAPIRAIVIALVCAGIAYVFWLKDIEPQLVDLAKAEEEEITLRQTLDTKQRKAANLEALKEQLAEMKQSFGDMIRQLPDKTEVAGLIVDISQTGLAAGLTFELFKPGKEKPAEFYSELPISIRVVGEYHQFGEFVSGIATLPRIVTTHDININRTAAAAKSKGSLVMTATAKTYRALDEDQEEEEVVEKKGKKKKKKKGRKS
ncbi:MAG: type 4a pilus biogenesis protein PilO [Gammaproteobacteria bacterium]|nr:type 4a pilus biogenesis protein PilO [Gammaproteobacteria bacterium]